MNRMIACFCSLDNGPVTARNGTLVVKVTMCLAIAVTIILERLRAPKLPTAQMPQHDAIANNDLAFVLQNTD